MKLITLNKVRNLINDFNKGEISMGKVVEEINAEVNDRPLEEYYQWICERYLVEFCKKQGINFEYWVGGIGGYACFDCELSLPLDTIVFDVSTNQPKGLVIQWQNDTFEHHIKGLSGEINYPSYASGLRYEDL